jgi:molybdopterin/thiamine biosynthesis adenylyltransferase
LAVAGVGKIRVIDGDNVELSNLNRQILHWDKDIGRAKVDSAKEKLESLNPDIEVEAINETITEDNVFELVADYAIVDAMDNLPARYLLNRAALRKNLPLFHGRSLRLRRKSYHHNTGQDIVSEVSVSRRNTGENPRGRSHSGGYRMHPGYRGDKVHPGHR